MKTLVLLCAVLAIAITPLAANDGIYVTRVIHETDSLYSLLLNRKQFIKITNFIQEGGTVGNVFNPDGSFAVVPTPASVVVYQGAAGLAGITVATTGGPNSVHEVTIAGPAVVNVAPAPGGTLFLTFLLGNQ
jgi:hypothetical protein